MYLIWVLSDYLILSFSVLVITEHTNYVTEKWTLRIFAFL